MKASDLCPCHPGTGKPPTDSLNRAGDREIKQGTQKLCKSIGRGEQDNQVWTMQLGG